MFKMQKLLLQQMNYNIFLDDERYPKQVTWVDLPLVEWTIVRNYKEFVALIEKQGLPQYISFDHDLGPESFKSLIKEGKIDYSKYKEKTGYNAAKWLINYCINNKINLPKYLVHSMNPIGKENIESLLNQFKHHQKYTSFLKYE